MFAPKEILVPTDFSELSDNALRYACDIARAMALRSASSMSLRSFSSATADYCLDGGLVAGIQAKIIESAQELIKKQITRVVKTEDGKVTQRREAGRPYAEILKELDEPKIDLVVMASHGKTRRY